MTQASGGQAELMVGNSEALAFDIARLLTAVPGNLLWRSMVLWEREYQAKLVLKRTVATELAISDAMLPMRLGGSGADQLMPLEDLCAASLWFGGDNLTIGSCLHESCEFWRKFQTYLRQYVGIQPVMRFV